MKNRTNNQYLNSLFFFLVIALTMSFTRPYQSTINHDLNGDGTINIMVIGTSTSINGAEAFSPNQIAVELQNILSADPAITANVHVVAEDIYTNERVAYRISNKWVEYFADYYRHSLTQYYYWPKDREARMDNLSGNGARDWDYVVIAADPHIVANMPGYYALGVNKVATKIAEGGAKPLLLMMWPKNEASELTIAHSEEFTYRTADGAKVPVAVIPAGLAWNALANNKKDEASMHPTPNGAYLAAATVYAHIFGTSASSSTYTYDDNLANVALSTVTTEKNKVHYSGARTFMSPFKSGDVDDQTISFLHTGSSTEKGIASGIEWVFDQAAEKLKWGGKTRPRTFNFGRANSNYEANKRYKVNPNLFHFSFGFPFQDDGKYGNVSMLYGLDRRNLGTLNDTDLGVARFMIQEAELPNARAIPTRTLFAQMREASPNQSAFKDRGHMHQNLDKASGAYMYTLLTGNINIVEEPARKNSSEWKTWNAAKIGHETAWNLMYLENLAAPNFDPLNSTPTAAATNVSISNTIIVAFDQNIRAGTGTIILRNITGAADIETFDITTATATTTPRAGAIGIVFDKLYINPTTAFSESNTYAIQIATTAIKHTSGLPFAGITEETTFNFSTGDFTAPLFDVMPTAASIMETGFTLNTDLNEAGDLFYVVVATNAPAPTSAEVIAQTGSGGSGQITFGNASVSTGGFINAFSVTDLTAATAYDIYVVARDTAEIPNVQTNVTKLTILTSDPNANNYIGLAAGLWSDHSNWSLNRTPNITDNITVLSGASGNLDISNLVVHNFTNLGVTTVSKTGSLTVNGKFTNDASTFTINSDATSTSGSLIVKGSSIGNITYNVDIPNNNWHLISSPVVGAKYNNDWVTNNSVPISAKNNRGISSYNNAVLTTLERWSYFKGGTTETFNTGIGYSMLRNTAGNFSFTGSYPTANEITPAISQNDNSWNLIGNPYPSYINIATFITANTEKIAPAFQAIYVWKGVTPTAGSYNQLNKGYLKPGEAFFIKSNVSNGTASITEDMQSHLETDDPENPGLNFFKSSNIAKDIEALKRNPIGTDLLKNQNLAINLQLSDGNLEVQTQIYYLEGKSAALDSGFDIGVFDGVSSNFSIFTRLVEDYQGINFEVQTLQNENYEAQTIPVGVKASIGKEVVFSAKILNLPTDIKVFLEDKATQTFTRLDEIGSEYHVTLKKTLHGVGRFYLHTSSSVLTTKDTEFPNISMFSSDQKIYFSGLPLGKIKASILDVLGKKVSNTSFVSNGVHTFSLPNITAGIYMVQLQTEKGKLTRKILIE